MSALTDKIREIAVSEGARIAEQFFAKRHAVVEVHVSLVEFAGMLAIAYEQGLEAGIVAAKDWV